MRILQPLSIACVVASVATMLFAVACSGGDDDDETTPQPAETSTATGTSTPTNTPSPTPSPTPTPFDGKISRMSIPSLGIDYPIEELGIIAAKNELDTPKNATGAIGWYHIYPKPGFLKNSLWSAHVNYNGTDGPFARLNKAEVNTEITVSMADGPTYTYAVFSKTRYTIYNIPMGDLIDQPTKPANDEWITLITCSCEPGRILDPDGDGFGECLDRDVVTARRIS